METKYDKTYPNSISKLLIQRLMVALALFLLISSGYIFVITKNMTSMESAITLVVPYIIISGILFSGITFYIWKFIDKFATLTHRFRTHYELLKEGQFYYRIKEKHFARGDEMGGIALETDAMQVAIISMIQDIMNSASSVDESSIKLSEISEALMHSSSDISSSMEMVTNNITKEANDIIDISEKIAEFKMLLNNNIEKTKSISNNANEVNIKASQSFEEMTLMSNSLNEFNEVFKKFEYFIEEMRDNIQKVEDITSLINNIAGQTSLLSLNAAIEAARAGESGKGFNVVASEIRSLSEQTKESSVNINSLINYILNITNDLVNQTNLMSNKLNDQTSIITNTMGTFNDIFESIQNITPEIEYLNSSSSEIIVSNDNILTKINEISNSSEDIVALSQEINSATEVLKTSSVEVFQSAEKLTGLAESTMNSVSKFKIEKPDDVDWV